MASRKTAIIVFIAACLLLGGAQARAQERFLDNGDGTVTDTLTGLMWAQSDNQGDVDWPQARQWVRYTLPDTLGARYGDWRLPTLEELQTLFVDDPGYAGYEAECGRTVRVAPAIRLSCSWVWTSEERSITARLFNFTRGHHYMDRKAHDRGYRALAVRPAR